MTSKILFYSDARDFGGHEYMTTSAVRFLAEQPHLSISFAYYDRNWRLHDELCRIKEGRNLTLYPLPVKSNALPGVRTLFWISRLPLLQSLMKSVAPDVVVVSQGNIEISSLGLLAARRANRRTISYIPMAHRLASSSGPMSAVRDMVDRYLYQLPDKVITISEGVKHMLRQRGVRCEVSVVCNGIKPDCSESGNRSRNRAAYGWSRDKYVIVTVGRIAFRQKAQDFLVNAITKYRDQLRGTRFCVVGEGPDEQMLRNMMREAKLENCISILPWSSNLAPLYSAADMLLIPSRFEGVPLVMLEAMWHQLPVVASNVDGMAQVLPREWLFQCGDAESLVKTILRVRHSDNSQLLVASKRRVLEEFSMSLFQERFCSEILRSGRSLIAGEMGQTPTDKYVHTR
jgi:glycosyltransferase involved in cell wall biosynthesis